MATGKYTNQLPSAGALLTTDYIVTSVDGLNLLQARISGIITLLNTLYAQVSHGHAQSDVTGLVTALATLQTNINNLVSAYAPISHGHAQSDISGLVTTLTNLQSDINARILTSQKGVANGVVPLAANTKIDIAYLPEASINPYKPKGFWNATTNIITSSDSAINGGAMPAASSLNENWVFIVTVAGSTSLNGINEWGIGDWVLGLGTSWTKVDNTDAVVSVNGKIGVVVIDQSDIAGLVTALATLQTNINNLVSVYAPISHTHSQADITSLVSDLASKSSISYVDAKIQEVSDLAVALAVSL